MKQIAHGKPFVPLVPRPFFVPLVPQPLFAHQMHARGSLMGDPVVMVSLYPEFPESVMSSLASRGEFVCLMDRSGSMGYPIMNSKQEETRISGARDTLLLLLKTLPMGCYFNIYNFGSTYEHIFPKSVEYNQQNTKEALKKVEQMEADLGGTEILQPLKHIYSQPCIPNQPRQKLHMPERECHGASTLSTALFVSTVLVSKGYSP